jgi:hypothetical protein
MKRFAGRKAGEASNLLPGEHSKNMLTIFLEKIQLKMQTNCSTI